MKRASPRYFLDTNIFVYTFDGTAPAKQAIARKLVGQALDDGNGVISFQVVQEFLNVATRKFAQPFSHSDAQLYLIQVLTPLCEIFPDPGLYSQALSFSSAARISFYDAMIVTAASRAGCSTLWTEDLNPGQRIGTVQIRNPFA